MSVLALACLLTLSGSAQAQAVRGRLLDGRSQSSIMLAVVTLLDSARVLVDRTYTDNEGRFELTAPRPGSYYVAAARDGYQPRVDGVLELPGGSTIDVSFYLTPIAFRLDSLVANAASQATVAYLRGQGFYERQRLGFGHFITPEMMEKRNLLNTGDLLRGIPGVRTDADLRGTIVRFRSLSGSGEGGYCTPRVHVDGAIADTAFDGNVVIEDFLDVDDLDAVEVYTSVARAPLHFAGLTTCGVILFWTRRGGR